MKAQGEWTSPKCSILNLLINFPCSENRLLSSKSVGAASFRLKFTTEGVAEEWRKYIQDEIDRPKLPNFFLSMGKLDKTFYNKLDGSIWRMILSGDSSLGAYYFDLTQHKNDDNGDPVDNVSYVRVFSRIRDLATKLMGKNRSDESDLTGDENIFTYLLYRMSRDTLDRVMLLLSDFEVPDIIEISNYTSSQSPFWLKQKAFQAFWSGLPASAPSLRYCCSSSFIFCINAEEILMCS